jgi:NAD(P)-dependent dehydrogenase (short-subunit alcohol dehydrogenase family)
MMSINNHWTTENIPDLTGKVAIVTGANSGIGFETARALAMKGATVVMACRNMQKGEAAAEKIRAEHPLASLDVKALDLADLSSVRQFADQFTSHYERLDMLINNAGVMATPYQKTVDGFEKQFGTNHLGHFALTGLLFDKLRGTPGSRVVTVSSYGHLMGGFLFNDFNSERFYQKWLAYSKSKLANLLFTYELQRKLQQDGYGTISVGAHPGYASTNLQSNTVFRRLNPFFAQSQEMGALPTLYAATAEDIVGGEYIGPGGFLNQRGYPTKHHSGKASYDQDTAQMLWEQSEKMTEIKYQFE